MAEETPEYTTTRQSALERQEIIVPEFIQRTFSLQRLGIRALLGLLRAGTSPSSFAKLRFAAPPRQAPHLRKYSLYIHPPPSFGFFLLFCPCPVGIRRRPRRATPPPSRSSLGYISCGGVDWSDRNSAAAAAGMEMRYAPVHGHGLRYGPGYG